MLNAFYILIINDLCTIVKVLVRVMYCIMNRMRNGVQQASKPLMEKKRRERINCCLDELKTILMDVTKKEVS